MKHFDDTQHRRKEAQWDVPEAHLAQLGLEGADAALGHGLLVGERVQLGAGQQHLTLQHLQDHRVRQVGWIRGWAAAWRGRHRPNTPKECECQHHEKSKLHIAMERISPTLMPIMRMVQTLTSFAQCRAFLL